MAEGGDDQERSEDPTQKRLDDAVKKGDVAKSQEVNTWFLLAGGTFALYSFGGYSAGKLARAFGHIFSHAHDYGMDGPAIIRLIGYLMFETPLSLLTDPLTSAERALVERLLLGDAHRAIAAHRGVSVRTIANQMSRLFEKLAVSSRAELIVRLLERARRR